MSTKTSIKRIALVAVAALSLGMVSTVSANAAVGTPTIPLWIDSTASTFGADNTTFVSTLTTPVTGVAYTKGLISGSMTAITVPLNTAVVFGVKASGSAFGTNDLFDLSLNGTIVASAVGDAAITADNLTYTFAKVGTYTGNIRVYVTGTTRAAATGTYDLPITITVGALDAFSPSLSTFYLNQGAVGTSSSDSLAVAGTSAVADLPVGVITYDLRNVKNGVTGGAVTAVAEATLAGPGYIGWSATDTYSATGCNGVTTRSKTSTAGSSGQLGNFYVCGDGTSGVATITIRVQDEDGLYTNIGTKTVTFFGDVTKLEVAKAIYTIGKAGGGTVGPRVAARDASTDIPAFVIKATDKNGVGVGGLTIQVVSSDITKVNTNKTTACYADTPATLTTHLYSSGGVGYYNCELATPTSAKSGDTATLTFQVLDPADTVNGTALLTATQAVSVGGAIATETLAFDKSSYAPGESIVYTVTGKDSAGNKPYDGQAAFGGTGVPNKAFGGTLPGATKLMVNGTATTSATAPMFAPVVPGDFNMTILNGAATAYLTASATVVDANQTAATAASQDAIDAANEATDAANAATDAANAAAEAADAATAAAQDAQAAVAALASQVADLISGIKAQITALTNLVVKIQKKVKA